LNVAVVVLSKDKTQIHVDLETRTKAIQAAYWVTASPHEWVWTPEQQVAMAQYVLWASQRLDAFRQLSEQAQLRHEKPDTQTTE
jgi:hypothetical protein